MGGWADDDFREFVDMVPEGCRITIVSDSCHSGGLIDEAKEQIGESTKQNDEESDSGGFGFKGFLKQTVQGAFESRGIHLPLDDHRRRGHRHHSHGEDSEEVDSGYSGQEHVKNKSLPLSTLIEILKQKTGKDDIDVGKLRPTLFDIFGEDSSPKVKKFMNVLMNKLQGGKGGDGGSSGGFMGMVGSLAQEFLKHKLEENNEGHAKPTKVDNKHEAYAGSSKRSLPDMGILVSGCQTDQTSADATPGGNASQSYGAMSNAIQTILAETDGPITNRELVLKTREILKKQGFTQRPGLYCSDHHISTPFIC